MKPDYLPGTPYLLIQPEGMYHMNSDTELLGRFLKIRHKDTVLDIGTHTGALLMYAGMHQLFMASIFFRKSSKLLQKI